MKNSKNYSEKTIALLISALILSLFIQLPCLYSILSVISDMDGNYKWIAPNFIDFWSFFVMPFSVFAFTIKQYKKVLRVLFLYVYNILINDEEIK